MKLPEINPAFVAWCQNAAGIDPSDCRESGIEVTPPGLGTDRYRINYLDREGVRREALATSAPPPIREFPRTLTVVDSDQLRQRLAETLRHLVEVSPGEVIEQPRYDMADAVLATLRREAGVSG